jgi:hypothetical protein
MVGGDPRQNTEREQGTQACRTAARCAGWSDAVAVLVVGGPSGGGELVHSLVGVVTGRCDEAVTDGLLPGLGDVVFFGA